MISASLHPETIRAACQRRNRWPFALTPRTILLLLAGFLLLIPGFYIPRLAWSMLVWDALILLAALLDALRLPKPAQITVQRSWSNTPALDTETEIELSIENHSRLLLDCRLVDDLPSALTDTPATHRTQAYPRLPAQIRYRIRPQERGDYETGWLYLRYRSPLSLAEKWTKAPLTQTIRIYPTLHTSEEQSIFLARSRQIEQQLRQARQRGLGRDFESLRDYRDGDDLRDICWTATARRGSLITRQYQIERSQAVWIVLDCGRLMRSRPTAPGADPSASHTKLDHATATALALAQLALYSGDRVGLLAYGSGIQQRLLPGRGASHLRQMMELLAQVRTETGEADHLRATAVLNRLQPRRSLVLWVTDVAETAMRPEVIEGAIHLLRRHVLLFVAMAQPEVERLAETRPKNVEEMFRAAAAQETAGRREILLAQLAEQGALTLDLAPDALTSSVLNQYLKVKERAMV